MSAPGQPFLELRLLAETVTLKQLVAAAGSFSHLLSEVGKDYAGSPTEPLRWNVGLVPGSVRVSLRPETAIKEAPFLAGPTVAALIIDGLAQLERQAERPRHFPDKALEQAKSLANLVGEGLPSIIVRKGEQQVSITKHIAANVDAILGAGRISYGTVEGRLDALNIHERPAFAVYDARTGRRVECHFGEHVTLQDVLQAVGKRVAVRGLIRARGDHLTMEARSLRVFPSEEELPSPREVLGILREPS